MNRTMTVMTMAAVMSMLALVPMAATDAASYSLTLDAGEGECDVSLFSGNNTVTLPVASLDGKAFLGWYDDNGALKGRAGEKYQLAKDETLHAYYTDYIVKVSITQREDGSYVFTPSFTFKGKALDNQIVSSNWKVDGKLAGMGDRLEWTFAKSGGYTVTYLAKSLTYGEAYASVDVKVPEKDDSEETSDSNDLIWQVSGIVAMVGVAYLLWRVLK